MAGLFHFHDPELQALYLAADAADDEYTAACIADGYKSRWDVTEVTPAIAKARDAKYAADVLLQRAFDARLEDARKALAAARYAIRNEENV